MRSMKKTAKILALVLGAAYAIGVAGCGEKEKTYDIPRDQYGFVCKPPIIISDPGMVIEVMAEAYRILEEEYDKSNVKIQIGYGTLRGKTNDLPEEGTFQMYFRDADIPFPCEENGCGYFIKDIEFLSKSNSQKSHQRRCKSGNQNRHEYSAWIKSPHFHPIHKDSTRNKRNGGGIKNNK